MRFFKLTSTMWMLEVSESMTRLAPYSKGDMIVISGLVMNGRESRWRLAQPTSAMTLNKMSSKTTLLLPNENNFKISSYIYAVPLR